MASDREQVGELFTRLARIATELGDAGTAEEAASIRERVNAGQFYVACVGQFKRGKSTLLDALLGDPVLPAGVTPVTAVPTVVRFGPSRTARVRTVESGWREIPVDALADYVSEERNPGNAKGVEAAEVLEPSPLLSNGLCLVDTPGIGSVFDANTQATLAFVPHIDVVLVVIGTDPPLSGDELRLIESAAHHANDLLVVLNKADRADANDRAEACVFAKRAIEQRLGRDVDKIYEVSAKEQLDSTSRWPDWEELVTALQRLAAGSGASVSLRAGERGVQRLRAKLARRIGEAREALTWPIEESEARLARLRALIGEAERKLEDLSPVLAAQERRLTDDFDQMAREFRARSVASAHDELTNRLSGNLSGFGPSLRRQAMRAAQDVVRNVIAEWLPEMRRRALQLFERSMQRFVESATTTWRGVQEAADELTTLPDVEEVVAALATESRFRFNEQITVAQPASPLRYLADVALGSLGMRGVIRSDAHRFLDWILELNVGRVESEVRDQVRDAMIALERALRRALKSARDGAEAAGLRAKHIRQAGAAAVASELTRLDSLEATLP